jgi:hypothetical protein
VDGWPGVFRPLRHHVTEHASRVVLDGRYAYQLGLAGQETYIAVCGSPCWPPRNPSPELPWCAICERTRALDW